MKSTIVQACTVNVTLYQEDVLKVCTTNRKNSFKKEVVLLSIVALCARELTQFSLLQKVVENHTGVSTWRSNQIEKEIQKSQKNPQETITTNNYMIIKESFCTYGLLPDFLVKRVHEKLLTKRTTVLSTLVTGFEVKLLSETDLKNFYIHKKHVSSAKQFVPFDKTFIRPIVELVRVPKRLIPNFPFSMDTVRIPLGTHFINSQKEVGLSKLPKLVILAGSEQHLVIAALQHYIRALARTKRKIIVIDLENELNGIIPTDTHKSEEDFPLTVYQVGSNFQLNICAIETPSTMKSRKSKHNFQSAVLAYILAFASGNRELYNNISHLQNKFFETMKVLPLEELTLKNILLSDTFTDSNTDQEFALMEQLQVNLRLFADIPELNNKEYNQEYNEAFSSGVTLFQFSTSLIPVKRVCVAFLMQLLAQRCDPEMVVIMTNASRLLIQEYGGTEEINTKLYTEAIGNNILLIERKCCLMLTTQSLVRLHPDIQQTKNTGIYFRFSSVEDREWIARRYALTQYIEDPNRFLQSLENEGLLFNENSPYTIDHFIPYTLTPVKLEPTFTSQAITVLKSDEISRTQFIVLMTILELLVETDLEKERLLRELESSGINNPPASLMEFMDSGYFIKEEHNFKQIFSILKKGSIFYQEYQEKIDQLPPPLNFDKEKIDNILLNIRERANDVERYNENEVQQLILDIQELTGSLLNKFFQTCEKIDWGLFKDYLNLQNIDFNTDKLLIRRLEILERIYNSTVVTSTGW